MNRLFRVLPSFPRKRESRIGHDRLDPRFRGDDKPMFKPVSLLLAAVLMLSGCGAVDAMKKLIYGDPPRTDLASIRVVADPGANQNSATALDIVFLYDAGMVDVLPKTGPDWFARKVELTRGMPTSLDVVSLQVPPSIDLPKIDLPKRYGSAIRVVVYANYIGKEGQVPGNLTRLKRAVIRLGPQSIAYASG